MNAKKLLAMVIVACAPAAMAQTVSPTTGGGADAQNVNTSGGAASVNQTVQLILPKATGLHLDVTTLTFDLTSLSTKDPSMYCVYGLKDTDERLELPGADYNSEKPQVQALPLGTNYSVSSSSWPNIKINGGPQVTSYPPIQIGSNGELVAGSKGYIVCYRSFILQKFSNGKQWDLTVTRKDLTGQGIQHLYMQDNPCDTAGAGTGLFEVPNGAFLHLVPKALATGPTGTYPRTPNEDETEAAIRKRCGYKSWLDDLIVVAVKINGDLNGTSTANLQYTLTTTAW